VQTGIFEQLLRAWPNAACDHSCQDCQPQFTIRAAGRIVPRFCDMDCDETPSSDSDRRTFMANDGSDAIGRNSMSRWILVDLHHTSYRSGLLLLISEVAGLPAHGRRRLGSASSA
jgi:hypothetical protein